MNFLNLNLFLLGILVLTMMFLCNLMFSFLCKKFNIKILEFSIFIYEVYKININGIDYILGWLPTSCYVKPFGMDSYFIENHEFYGNEINKAFFTKNEYQKALIFFTPSLVFLFFGIFLPILYLNFQNGYSLYQHYLYIVEFFKSLNGNEMNINNFGHLTKEIILKSNIILFSFLLFSTIMFFWSFFDNFKNYLNSKDYKITILTKAFNIIVIIMSLFFIFTIPFTIFKYFDLHKVFIYLLNALFGIYISGIFVYTILIYFLKRKFKIKNISTSPD